MNLETEETTAKKYRRALLDAVEALQAVMHNYRAEAGGSSRCICGNCEVSRKAINASYDVLGMKNHGVRD